MKKVRICPSCGWCNLPTNHNCDHCQTPIDFDLVEVTRVEDDVERVTLTQKEEAEAKPEKPETKEQPKENLCPNCSKSVPEGEMFCPNCGSPMDGSFPLATSKGLLLLINGEKQYRLEFPQPFVYFGRKYTPQETISSNLYISSLHLVFFFIEEKFYLQDVSSNGTRLNGEKMTRGILYPLHFGDILLLENITVQIQST